MLQPAAAHRVELHSLARGQAQGAVRVLVGQRVEGEALGRGQAAGGRAHAHHELPVLVPARLLAGGRGVAVELLVGAVELEEGVGRLAQPAGRVGQGELLRDGAAKPRAGQLDPLGPARLRCHREIPIYPEGKP